MDNEKTPFLRKIARPFLAVGRFFGRIWRWYKGQWKGRPWWYKLWTALWSFFAFIIFYVFAVFFNFLWLFGKSPSIERILHPKAPMATQIYSADGVFLGKIYKENRTPVPYDSISPAFFQALIATEDERFYEHHGVDFAGIGGAVKDAFLGHARGASTISQQLVKNMFGVRTEYSTGLLGKIPGLRIVIMKSKEIIIACIVEMCTSKEDILKLYANSVDFGDNTKGINAAARTYFNTTPLNLKPEQAAVLVGLLKATTSYNPRLNPERSKERRNTVLQNMYNQRRTLQQHFDNIYVADEPTLRRLQGMDLTLDYTTENPYSGRALYFRDIVKKELTRLCESGEIDLYADEIYTAGLKVRTSLDSKMQDYAEKAVREHMRGLQRSFFAHWRGQGDPWRDENGNVLSGFIEDKLKQTDVYKSLTKRFPNDPDSVRHYLNQPHPVKLFGYDGGETREMSSIDSLRYMVQFMHTGFVAMEPETGEVKAYVGDVDYETWQYDKVQARHQPGSTFKLFVYSTAMKQGMTPNDTRKDEYIDIDGWKPRNANGRFSGAELPLHSAFARSINTIAVKLGQELGVSNVIQTAHDMGIKSEITNDPSVPLGTCNVNVLEMVNGYCTVANNGLHVDPVLILSIEDAEGNEIYKAERNETRALPQSAAFYMQKMLEAGVREGGGTSQTLGAFMYLGPYAPHLDFGGKTGSTNNYSDAWFIGVTPSLVAGCWVGGESPNVHFRTGSLGQGSRAALPLVAKFLRAVMDDSHLQQKYLHKYGMPPENVDPSTFENPYDQAERDSTDLANDSIVGGEEQINDLMGGEGSSPEGSEPAQSTDPTGEGASQHAEPQHTEGGNAFFE